MQQNSKKFEKKAIIAPHKMSLSQFSRKVSVLNYNMLIKAQLWNPYELVLVSSSIIRSYNDRTKHELSVQYWIYLQTGGAVKLYENFPLINQSDRNSTWNRKSMPWGGGFFISLRPQFISRFSISIRYQSIKFWRHSELAFFKTHLEFNQLYFERYY